MLLTLLLSLIIIFAIFVIAKLFITDEGNKFPPGPIGIPVLGYLPFLAPNAHVKIGELGRKYGNIFSLKMGSYKFVVLNDFETVKSALKLDSFSGRPNHLLAMSVVPKGIVYNDGPTWLEQRRFALRTLGDFGLGKSKMENIIQHEVRKLTGHLRTKLNTSISLKDMLAISILNNIWQITAGTQFSLEDNIIQKVYSAGKEGFMQPKIQGPVYFLPWLSNLMPGITGLNTIRNAVVTLHTIIDKTVKDHQQRSVLPESSGDFIDAYLKKMKETTDPNSSFYKEEGFTQLRDTLIVLFMGGSDTVSCTLGFAFLYLTAHQNVMRKVQSEIDDVIGRSRDPDYSDRQRMPFTESVLLEVLRMSSVTSGSILHSTTEDVEFMGYLLPKGTIVLPNLYQIHHNTKYWGDPENFRPDRFLNADGSFRKDERVIAYSIGKRVCMGENLAQVELFLFLTGVLQNFDLNEDPNEPLPSFEAETAFILSPQPYRIVLSER